MEDILNFKNRNIIFSLDWKNFDLDKTSKRELLKYVKQSGFSSGILSCYGKDVSIGISSTKKGISFAALIGYEYRNGIFCLELNDGLYSIIHVIDGLVVVHRDMIANKDEAETTIKDWLEFAIDTPLFGVSSIFPSDTSVKNISVDKILSDSKKTSGNIRFLPFLLILNFYKRHIFYSFIVFFLLLAGGINLLKKPQPEITVPIISAAELAQNTINLFYQNKITPLITKSKPVPWVSKINGLIQELPYSINGWDINNITCISNQDKCKITYKSNGFATNEYFEDFFTVSYDTGYGIKGNLAWIFVKLSRNKSLKISPKTFYDTLPIKHEFLVDALSEIQKSLMSGLITYHVDNVTVTNKRKNDKKSHLPGLSLHKWTLHGELLFYMEEAVSFLDSQAFFVDKLLVDFTSNKKEKWTVEGIYVSK